MPNQRISCIVLGTCDCETVAKAIHLFRIDRKYSEATVEEYLDESTPRSLNCYGNHRGLTRGTSHKTIHEVFKSIGCSAILQAGDKTST